MDRLHARRWSHLAVANLRILLGFAFVPAGLKKVLGQPFTAAENTGPFHDFLDAFLATGFFYPFVGGVQLFAALLLMSQTFGALGAAITLPVLTTITVFCWSTGVWPTAIVATLMWLGAVALLVWDFDRWIALVHPALARRSPAVPADDRWIDPGMWRLCGLGVLILYGLACWIDGGVYRPRGPTVADPAFLSLVGIALLPLVTLAVEQSRRARRRPTR
ncbi:MAG: hypothetical protein AAGN46_02200 [Acidobacteriota bacterium]